MHMSTNGLCGLPFIKCSSGTNLGHDRRLAAARFSAENERLIATGTDYVAFPPRLLLLLRRCDVISDKAQDVIATFELSTAIATHGQVLYNLDHSRLKEARPGLGQTAFGRSADQPLKLVAERVAETL